MMYRYCKILLLYKTDNADITSKNLISKFSIEGIKIVDVGYDAFSYNFTKSEKTYVFYVIIKDKDNKFLEPYIKNSIKNITANIKFFDITEKQITNLKRTGFK